MQNRNDERPHKRILVVNYDQCAFTLNGTHPHLLSKPLLNFAQSTSLHFDGFYGLTSRQIYTLKSHAPNSIYEANIRRLAGTDYTVTQFKNNWQTYRITQNFEAESGLPCFGVATPEDYRKQFGRGYTHVIKPFEITGKENNPISFMNSAISRKRSYLLTRVANDAAKRYPNAEIQLVYVDDNITQCHKATTVCDQRYWPENVRLDIYQHSVTKESGDHTPIRFVQSVKPLVQPMVLEDSLPSVSQNQHAFFNASRMLPATPPPSPKPSLTASTEEARMSPAV